MAGQQKGDEWPALSFDERLIAAYTVVGRRVEELPDSRDFEVLFVLAEAGESDAERYHVYQRLLQLQKRGRLPRLGLALQRKWPRFSIRAVMVAVLGLALVFWLMFARDEGTILLAIFSYLGLSAFLLGGLPLFLVRQRCQECGARELQCVGLVVFRPPLVSYYACAKCDTPFRGSPVGEWRKLQDPLPGRMIPQRRASGLLDPLVWKADPLPPPPQSPEPEISFAEESQP